MGVGAAAALAALPVIASIFQKPNTTNFAQQLAPMIGGESAQQQALLDLIAKTPPEFTPIDINQLNDLVQQQAMLSAYRSKIAERELDPALAQLRERESADLLSDYEGARSGNLPQGVQNALVRAGLGAAIRGGGAISPTSIGKGSSERVFGMGATNYLDKLRSLVMQKTASTPQPMVAIDPGDAANISVSNIKDRDSLTNQFHQQLLNATGQAHGNLSNYGRSLAEGAVREGMSNTAIKNAKQKEFLGTLSGLSSIGGIMGGTGGRPASVPAIPVNGYGY